MAFSIAQNVNIKNYIGLSLNILVNISFGEFLFKPVFQKFGESFVAGHIKCPLPKLPKQHLYSPQKGGLQIGRLLEEF